MGHFFRRAARIFENARNRHSYALNELDRRLEPFMKKEKGFFVEVGANDGINQSNTFYFERYMGWTGLLIEAIPDLAEACRKNRSQCIVENCALVADDYLAETVEMQYCNLMSLVKGAMGGPEKDGAHIQLGRQFLKEGEETYSVRVVARTLSWVLDKHCIKNIDLLSLDVEGYEGQVLKGIDFNRHRPVYMLVEVRHDRRVEIELALGNYYKPLAILHINEFYSDVLYQRTEF